MITLVISWIMRELFNEITEGTASILFIVMILSISGLAVSVITESWLTHSLIGITMFSVWFAVIAGLYFYDTRK